MDKMNSKLLKPLKDFVKRAGKRHPSGESTGTLDSAYNTDTEEHEHETPSDTGSMGRKSSTESNISQHEQSGSRHESDTVNGPTHPPHTLNDKRNSESSQDSGVSARLAVDTVEATVATLTSVAPTEETITTIVPQQKIKIFAEESRQYERLLLAFEVKTDTSKIAENPIFNIKCTGCSENPLTTLYWKYIQNAESQSGYIIELWMKVPQDGNKEKSPAESDDDKGEDTDGDDDDDDDSKTYQYRLAWYKEGENIILAAVHKDDVKGTTYRWRMVNQSDGFVTFFDPYGKTRNTTLCLAANDNGETSMVQQGRESPFLRNPFTRFSLADATVQVF